MSSLTGATPEFDAGLLPRGVTPPSGAGGRVLSDVIVELGFADRETVDRALDASRAPGKKLGTTLVEMGALSERQLARAVAERYRLDFLDLSEFSIDPEAVDVIGDAEMRRYEAVPVAFTEDGALVVAMVDPADWLAAEEMAQLAGRRIRRAVAAPSEVIELIARVTETKSAADGHWATQSTSSAMPSRLTLRPVSSRLAGPALGSKLGVDGASSEDSSPHARPPRTPTEAPVEPAAFARPPADPRPEASEGRVIPLTQRTGPHAPPNESVESPVRYLAEATALEAELYVEAEARPAVPDPGGRDTSEVSGRGPEREAIPPPADLAPELEQGNASQVPASPPVTGERSDRLEAVQAELAHARAELAERAETERALREALETERAARDDLARRVASARDLLELAARPFVAINTPER